MFHYLSVVLFNVPLLLHIIIYYVLLFSICNNVIQLFYQEMAVHDMSFNLQMRRTL